MRIVWSLESGIASVLRMGSGEMDLLLLLLVVRTRMYESSLLRYVVRSRYLLT